MCIFCVRFQRIIRSICTYFSPLKLLFFCHYSMPCTYKQFFSGFHPKNLQRIMRIFWPTIISNELLDHCHQDSTDTIIVKKRWKWIRHVLRKEAGNITRTAIPASLDTIRQAQERQTKEHPAPNSIGTHEHLQSQLRPYKSRLRIHRGGGLRGSCPSCQQA